MDQIDHIIVFAPTLDAGVDHVEAQLGMRPVPGGRHPAFGTHNALLSLGAGTYLEVMAPDPAAEQPMDPAVLGLGPITRPLLATWVLRAEAIEAVHARAEGFGLGPISDGHRDNPDGSRLSWRLSSPFAFPCHGVVPFLIAWGDSPHPSGVLPEAGRLVDLSVAHPDPDTVLAAYEALGVDIPVVRAERPRLMATIDTPAGRAWLG